MNFIKGYDSGRFSESKLFTEEYGVLPNRLIFNLEEETFDLEKIDSKFIEKNFPDASYNITKTLGEGEAEENPEIIELKTLDGSFDENYIFIFDEKCYYFILPNKITILYYDIDIDAILNRILSLLPRKDLICKSTEVQLVAFNQDYYTISSNITPMKINIKENYNDDFLPIYEDIKAFLTNRESGLVVLRGTIGSGKTTFIRYLITSFPKKYILVTNALAEHIASPEFISFMLDNKDSIFILEDCEQILMDRGNSFNSAISNILNMSDGLLSDIFNIKFICTFNADINKIDPALLRKGRCFANYEFQPLCLEKTNILLKKLNLPESTQPLTLAEIYNYNNSDYKIKENNKIGF